MKIIFRNLAYNKFRTFLSISGIAVAVISIILIGSIGNGLLVTGEKTLERSSMQIWLTGKMMDIQSQFAGGTEGKITDSHKVAAKLLENSNIIWARPVLTEILYVYKEGNEPKAVFGLGVATTGSGKDFVSVMKGKSLIEDTNYNNGMYNGERQDEVMIDERAARLLGINLDDTIYIGKTLTEAKNQTFKIVGITNSLSSFTPGSMVILYLSELQEMTGNQNYDSVNLVMMRLKDPSLAEKTQTEIEAAFPEYAVSSNLNMLKKIAKQNSPLLASAISIVLLAVLMGTLLAINTMLLSLNERKNEIGIMKVLGFSWWSIFKYIGLEGFLICILGGFSGILLSLPLSSFLNSIIYEIVGFNSLVLINDYFIYISMILVIFIGLITSFIAVMQINRKNTAQMLHEL